MSNAIIFSVFITYIYIYQRCYTFTCLVLTDLYENVSAERELRWMHHRFRSWRIFWLRLWAWNHNLRRRRITWDSLWLLFQTNCRDSQLTNMLNEGIGAIFEFKFDLTLWKLICCCCSELLWFFYYNICVMLPVLMLKGWLYSIYTFYLTCYNRL